MSKFADIKIGELIESKTNPRFGIEIGELAKSIEAVGILEPLVVRKVTAGYEVIAGHRRLAAAKALKLASLPCAVRADKGDIQHLHLAENFNRADLTPAETGLAVWNALAAKKMKQKDLAAALGKPESTITKYKTIGQALNKFAHPQADEDVWYPETAKMCGITDSEKAYNYARELLGLDKKETARTKKKQQMQLVPPTLDELLQALFERSGAVGAIEKLSATKDGKGFDVNLCFNSEAEAIKFFNV